MKKFFDKAMNTLDFKTIGGRTYALVLGVEYVLYASEGLPAIWKYGFMTGLAVAYAVMQKWLDGKTDGKTASSNR